MSDLIWVDVDLPITDTVEEHIVAVREAARGLIDPRVHAREFYECSVISVMGQRERTEDEQAEFDRASYIHWLAAKGIYERGLSKYARPAAAKEDQ